VNKYLRITLDPLVKFLVRSRRIVDVDLMRNNEAWLGFSRDNHISQVSIISFHVTLAGPNSKTLVMSVCGDRNEVVAYLLEQLSK
jgi:hypothetical protein